MRKDKITNWAEYNKALKNRGITLSNLVAVVVALVTQIRRLKQV